MIRKNNSTDTAMVTMMKTAFHHAAAHDPLITNHQKWCREYKKWMEEAQHHEDLSNEDGDPILLPATSGAACTSLSSVH